MDSPVREGLNKELGIVAEEVFQAVVRNLREFLVEYGDILAVRGYRATLDFSRAARNRYFQAVGNFRLEEYKIGFNDDYQSWNRHLVIQPSDAGVFIVCSRKPLVRHCIVYWVVLVPPAGSPTKGNNFSRAS